MNNDVIFAYIYHGNREFKRFTGEDTHLNRAIRNCLGYESESRIQIDFTKLPVIPIKLSFTPEESMTINITLRAKKDNKRKYMIFFHNREVFGQTFPFPEQGEDFDWEIMVYDEASLLYREESK